MLKFLTILLFVPSVMCGQGNIGCWPSESPLGYIYNKTTFTNTSDFTLHGGITMALNGSAINIGGAAGSYDRYASVLTPHSFANWTMTTRVKVTSATSATTYGFAIGIKSINPLYPLDIIGSVYLSNSVLPGKIAFSNSTGSTSFGAPSSSTISWSQNDVLEATLSLADSVFNFSVRNVTTSGSPISISYAYSNTYYSPDIKPNGSNFILSVLGGTYQMQSLSITVPDNANSNVVVASDSKYAYWAGSWAYGWPKILNNNYPNVTTFAGASDKAADALQQLSSLALLNPRYLIWEYGSNDLRDNVPLATVEAASDNVYNYFAARGTTVYFILIPEDSTAGGVGQKSLDLWYRSNYPANYISAVWDSLSANNKTKPQYLADGSIHLNAAGHAKLAQALVISDKLSAQGLCGKCESPATQAYGSNTQTGNQAHRGELGMEFFVNNASGIIIKQLGAFDDGNNGITGLQPGGGIRVAIFNKATHNIVPGLDVTISGMADASIGNHRMKNISPTITLPPGNYVIVAKGYYSNEKNGNVGAGGGPYPLGSDGLGAVTFSNECSFGPDDPVGFHYPGSAVNFGHPHEFLAGTFSYTTAVSCVDPVTNADLSNLLVSEGSLTPSFNSETTAYSVLVVNTITSINVTPTQVQAGAVIRVNGTVVVSGGTSGAIALSPGNNIITIIVTAQDGASTKTYTINVTRAASGGCESAVAQAYISTITTGNQSHRGELGLEFMVNNPAGILVKQLGAFDDGANGLTGLQANGGIRVAIFKRSTHTIVSGLDVIITGQGDAYAGNYRMKNISPVTLPTGDYVIVAKGYHVGEKNGNIGLGGGPYPPGDNGGGAITFGSFSSFGPDDPNGFSYPAYEGNYGIQPFLAGTFNFTTVIACGGPSTDANLSNLVLSQGTLSPTFAAGVINYTASVSNSTSSITVTPTASGTGATIKVNGVTVNTGVASGPMALAEGSNTISIVVTAQDATRTKTYTVIVTRAAPPGCESAPYQAYTSNTQTGNQAHRGELGLRFIVNNPNGILVKQLGAFDDGNNGITGLQPGGGVRVAIFNHSTNLIVPGFDVTISGLADAYTGNHRMKNISPTTLPQGDYVIVAKGFHAGERNGNVGLGGGPFPVGQDGNGSITFTGESSFGPDNPVGFSYPNAAGNYGTSHQFLAGSLSFTVIATCSSNTITNSAAAVTVSDEPQPKDIKQTALNKNIKVYPNLTNGPFNVQITDISPSKLNIQIINSNGKLVEQKIISLTSKTASLVIPYNLINLPSGIYMVKVISKNGVQVEKLVIER